ncbi:MAG: hypothetical protein DI551_05115, partial [Micavibrio aeruginosavorus]
RTAPFLKRMFGAAAKGDGEDVCRLIITLDPTLTDINADAKKRAQQARAFIDKNNADIAELFTSARVITCDGLPRAEAFNRFSNDIGVWVRERDRDAAMKAFSRQQWVSAVATGHRHKISSLIHREIN